MSVNIISETAQEFRGRRYYKCGEYFQRDGERLHRVVWEFFNGEPVPDGFHVHHTDHDKTNNQPDNLELLAAAEHMHLHNEGHGRGIPSAATEAAKDWHKSDEGREWHRQHYENFKQNLHRDSEFVCQNCGSTFIARDNGLTRYCSNNCKSAWRKKTGVDDETRQCVECGSEFRCNKYAKKQTCSRKCHGSLSGRKRRRSV